MICVVSSIEYIRSFFYSKLNFKLNFINKMLKIEYFFFIIIHLFFFLVLFLKFFFPYNFKLKLSNNSLFIDNINQIWLLFSLSFVLTLIINYSKLILKNFRSPSPRSVYYAQSHRTSISSTGMLFISIPFAFPII